MTERALVERARAKVNLYLHVTGQRSDGYHLIDSLIVFVDLEDLVRVEPADALSLTIEGAFATAVPTGADNLVLRAARSLAQAAGVEARARISLCKRLPASAGIGGGSADAAATLRALCDHWEVRPAAEDLRRLALSLGADVPVCLDGRPSFVGGIGEQIEPAPDLPRAWLVLANPGIAVPTAGVFQRREGAFSSLGRFTAAPADARALADLLADRRNDLTEPAIAVAPIIAPMLAQLEALPEALLARMSGSGATGFALFADESEAMTAADTLRAARPSWWIATAPIAP